MSEKIENAEISRTTLGFEGHGILTFSIYTMRGSIGQGFGGINLDYAGHNFLLIRKILEVAGVDDWESLKGKLIRVKSVAGHIEAIGNIIDDKWFNLQEYLSKVDKPND